MQYKFLIYISYSYSIPIGEPLENEILNKGDNVMWFSDTKQGFDKIKHQSNTLSSIQDVINYEPHIVLTLTNLVPDFISGLKVQVFHGFNAKKRKSKKNKYSHFNIRGFFDLYCTQGPSTTCYFNKLAAQYKHFKVIETGWPKVDPLFQTESSETIYNNIMIASTFTKSLSLAFDDSFYQEIKRLVGSGKYNFQMVLHPKMPSEIVEKWKKLNSEHFEFIDTYNLIPVFKNNRLLVSDNTSAISEFLLQEKPVIAYKNINQPDYLINIDTASQLELLLISKNLLSEELLKNIRHYNKELHPYSDGLSSKRVIDSCIQYLHEDKTSVKSKPVNLIRKFKIRKKLKHFTLKTHNKPLTICK